MPVLSHTPRFFATPSAFRRWLGKNHQTADELWVGFHKKGTGRKSITWPESVDQALCFGWIDGVRKSIDDSRYTIRFTRRRPRSIWSAVNIKRALELIDRGLMESAGNEAFAKRDPKKLHSSEQRQVRFPPIFVKRIRSHERAWLFFQSLPPSIRRLSTRWIMSGKKEETRLKRLALLISSSAKRELIPPLRFGRDR